jgi:hypothetical protein
MMGADSLDGPALINIGKRFPEMKMGAVAPFEVQVLCPKRQVQICSQAQGRARTSVWRICPPNPPVQTPRPLQRTARTRTEANSHPASVRPFHESNMLSKEATPRSSIAIIVIVAALSCCRIISSETPGRGLTIPAAPSPDRNTGIVITAVITKTPKHTFLTSSFFLNIA